MLLFAEDIAKRHRISVRGARKLLVRLERTHGKDVVGRVSGRGGDRRYMTEASYERLGPSHRAKLEDIYDRLTMVEDEVAALRRDIQCPTNRIDNDEPKRNVTELPGPSATPSIYRGEEIETSESESRLRGSP